MSLWWSWSWTDIDGSSLWSASSWEQTMLNDMFLTPRFWETWSTVSLLLILLSSSPTRYLSQKISGFNCIDSLIYPKKCFVSQEIRIYLPIPTIQARLSNLVREKTFSWDVPQHRYCSLVITTVIRLFIKIYIFRLLGYIQCSYTTYVQYICMIYSQTVGSSCEHERCRLVHCNKALGGLTKLDRNICTLELFPIQWASLERSAATKP